MALARMSPYGGNGSGDESEEASPPDADKPAVTGDPKRRSPSPGKESPKRRHSGASGGAESGAGRGAPNSLEKAHSFAAVSEASMRYCHSYFSRYRAQSRAMRRAAA